MVWCWQRCLGAALLKFVPSTWFAAVRRPGAVLPVPSAAHARTTSASLKSVGVQADKIASPARSNRTAGGKSGATIYGTTVNEHCRSIVTQTRIMLPVLLLLVATGTVALGLRKDLELGTRLSC